ncbi:hypothetical protein [Paraburkholderia fynbosensis]|uniref:hypothetical protein n=1 Tax=Paraburkholderia fynbosensis TaxID=1200993 RepID=UPI001581972F
MSSVGRNSTSIAKAEIDHKRQFLWKRHRRIPLRRQLQSPPYRSTIYTLLRAIIGRDELVASTPLVARAPRLLLYKSRERLPPSYMRKAPVVPLSAAGTIALLAPLADMAGVAPGSRKCGRASQRKYPTSHAHARYPILGSKSRLAVSAYSPHRRSVRERSARRVLESVSRLSSRKREILGSGGRRPR